MDSSDNVEKETREVEDEEEELTMVDVLERQQNFEEDAAAVLGASDPNNCTYSQGYVKRQALYACLTCTPDAETGVQSQAGICLACSLACHDNHNVVELYTKRHFRCDCGGPKYPGNVCTFNARVSKLNMDNKYNHNFAGLYCTCRRPYPDPENNDEDEMIQCIICEDWLHAKHLNSKIPPPDQYSEMVCQNCMVANKFLSSYATLSVNADEDNDLDVTDKNADISVGENLNNTHEEEKPSVNTNDDNALTENDKMIVDDEQTSVKETVELNTVENETVVEESEINKSLPKETESEAIPSSSENQTVPNETENQTIPNETENQTVPNETENVTVPDETENQTVPNETENQTVLNKTESVIVSTETENQTVLDETENQAVPDKTESVIISTKTENQTVPNETENQTVPNKTESQLVSNGTEDKIVQSEIENQTVLNEIENVSAPIGTENQAVPDEAEKLLVSEESENKIVTNESDQIINSEKVNVENDVSMNEIESEVKPEKRKIEENGSTDAKRIKLGGCQKLSIDNVIDKATFWPGEWRSKLCSCSDCMNVYTKNEVLFLLDNDDTVTAYELLGKNKTESIPSQYEEGLAALSSLGHVQQINAITEYNKMKTELFEFLKTLKNKKEVVKEEDIKRFFAGMRPNRDPDGVYFCK